MSIIRLILDVETSFSILQLLDDITRATIAKRRMNNEINIAYDTILLKKSIQVSLLCYSVISLTLQGNRHS